MSASAALVTHAFAVGRRMVLITLGRPDPKLKIAPASVEWSPDVPTSQLPIQEQRQFEAGRYAALAMLAEILGGGVVAIDSNPPPAPNGD